MDRLALASAGVPFKLKVAIVWIALFVVLGFFLSLAGFDLGWIRESPATSRPGSPIRSRSRWEGSSSRSSSL